MFFFANRWKCFAECFLSPQKDFNLMLKPFKIHSRMKMRELKRVVVSSRYKYVAERVVSERPDRTCTGRSRC